ncbi:hypothetical protein [Flexivirga alba]|uniref:Uncharacterized protein n=1 Tax=Flexivirga alba TaxID=702742 RepID=A0ABW2AH93_9MICO
MADAYAAVCNDRHWDPTPTSPITFAVEAEHDDVLREARQELAARAAFNFGVAIDNLKGMAALLGEPEIVFAVAAQARAAIENAALCFHFAEPGISSLKALARTCNADMIGIHQLRMVGERLPEPQRTQQLAVVAARRYQLMHRLNAHGLTLTKPTQDRTQPTVRGHVSPSISSLIAAITEPDRLGRNVYSYLSAVAHGYMHGLSEYVAVTEWDDGPLARGNVTVTPQQEAVRYGSVPLIMHRAADRLFQQFGWPQDRVALPANNALVVWKQVGGWP